MIRLAKNQLVFLLAATAAACSRDSTTEPSLTDTELRLEAVSATQLEGIVTERVSPVPTVIVKTTTGRPVAGVKVLFAKQRTTYWKSEAFVTDSIVVTDSRGIATPGNWKLSTEAGVHVLDARIVDARVQHVAGADSNVVSFFADAKAGPATLLSRVVMSDTIALPGDEIEGPVVRVTDRYGNSADGVIVSFSVTGGRIDREKHRRSTTWLRNAGDLEAWSESGIEFAPGNGSRSRSCSIQRAGARCRSNYVVRHRAPVCETYSQQLRRAVRERNF